MPEGYVSINNCLTDLMVVSTSYSTLNSRYSPVLDESDSLCPCKVASCLVIWVYKYYVVAIPFLALITSTGTSLVFERNSAYPKLAFICIIVLSILTLV